MALYLITSWNPYFYINTFKINTDKADCQLCFLINSEPEGRMDITINPYKPQRFPKLQFKPHSYHFVKYST